jgi:hypothetical protein
MGHHPPVSHPPSYYLACGTHLDRLTQRCANVNTLVCTAYAYDALGNITMEGETSNTFSVCGLEKCIANKTGATTNWKVYHNSEGRRTRFNTRWANSTEMSRY